MDKFTIRCLVVVMISGLIGGTTLTGAQEIKPYNGEIQSGYIEVENGKLFYEMAGSGEWMVLVHDGLLHRETWNDQFLVFASKYRVVRYDRRGYGKSAMPTEPFSNVADLDRVFSQLGIDKAIMIGMSAGGGLVIDFALKYPEKVSSVILVGAVISGFEYTSHFFTRGGLMNMLEVQDDNLFKEYILYKDPYEIYAENDTARKKMVELVEANPNDIDRTKYQYTLPPEQPAINRLNQIGVPALIIVGEHDIPDCHAHAGAIDAGIPDSYRIVVNNAGHLVPLERPGEFNELVFRFISESKFFSVLNNDGIDPAIEYYEAQSKLDDGMAVFSENRLNGIAYSLLYSGSIDDAIKLFRLNTIAYPESWNVYDSYGEALMMKGDTARAVINYEKSISMNPNNRNAAAILSGLKK